MYLTISAWPFIACMSMGLISPSLPVCAYRAASTACQFSSRRRTSSTGIAPEQWFGSVPCSLAL